jgi:hypothetical protein
MKIPDVSVRRLFRSLKLIPNLADMFPEVSRAEMKGRWKAEAKQGEEPVPSELPALFHHLWLIPEVLIVMDSSRRIPRPWPKPGLAYS